jgi:hypothetical protein
MCRAVTLVFVLAALAVSFAFGGPASAAKTDRRAPGARPVHHPSASARGSRIKSQNAHRAAGSRSTVAAAHRPSASEVGRAAGLKIRREMARTSGYRHTYPQGPHLQRTPYRAPSRLRRAEPVRVSYRAPVRDLVPENPRTASGPEPDVAGNGEAADPERAELNQTAQPGGDTEAPVGSESPVTRAIESAGDAEPAEAPGVEAGPEVASLGFPKGVLPPPLRGSLASLERQNDRLTAEGLERILDEDDLAARIANKLLVPVPVSAALSVNGNLPVNHRYCRPWTARFLTDLATAHLATFHRPLEVSSAVRTVAYQKRLMGINGNAAAAEGDIVSPHLTGATIDIAKAGLTRAEMGWMRQRLLGLEAQGKIDVEEEFQQACFHITVYKSYAALRSTRRAPSRAQAPEAPAKSRESDSDAAAADVAAQGL